MEQFSRMTLPRTERYRSFWNNKKSSSVTPAGVATFARKKVPVVLSPIPNRFPNIQCSHQYYAGIPFPNHELFSTPGYILATDHEKFVLVNVYFPIAKKQGNKVALRKRLQMLLKDYCSLLLQNNRDVVIVGDFGFTPENQDCTHPLELSEELLSDRNWFNEMISLGFVDCFRHLYPNDRVYSVQSPPDGGSGGKNDLICSRTSLVLANSRFTQNHLIDCFYLKFSAKYPLPHPKRKSPSRYAIHQQSSSDKPLENQTDIQTGTEKEDSSDQSTDFPTRNFRVIRPNVLPIILQTNIHVPSKVLPSTFSLDQE